ncbi:uncharacterized protein B0H18DRAFT_1068233, partial [Fomitopsis serialis]|uniref:uncharacterized protein n=1 Tax=Fomitopsis serialis TaxID=139415 RepID=UPI002007714B
MGPVISPALPRLHTCAFSLPPSCMLTLSASRCLPVSLSCVLSTSLSTTSVVSMARFLIHSPSRPPVRSPISGFTCSLGGLSVLWLTHWLSPDHLLSHAPASSRLRNLSLARPLARAISRLLTLSPVRPLAGARTPSHWHTLSLDTLSLDTLSLDTLSLDTLSLDNPLARHPLARTLARASARPLASPHPRKSRTCSGGPVCMQ